MKDISSLEEKIKIKFKDSQIIKTALTHRSYLNEHPDIEKHNERLEFLGDAVLELIVTESLFRQYPNPEGELTNWRASLVNSQMLAQVAGEIGLEDYLLLSRGEAKDANSKARLYILANAFEALIGAIYLDQGFTVSGEFIKRAVLSKLDYILANKLYIDAKSHFQEMAQEKVGLTPTYYVLEESGPDHIKIFKIGVYLDQELVATGSGSSKQEAQLAAAETALQVKNWAS